MQNSINKENAQYSTGPKTPEGKQISSMNALTHGLTSQQVVMPAEDPKAYQRHLKSFTDEYRPKGPTEANLVQAIADACWRLNRIVALEAGAQDFKSLATLGMLGQRLARQFEKAAAQLREFQKIRRAQEKLDLTAVVNIMEMKGPTYDPSKDGFVFSATQLAEAKRARHRENLTREADLYYWSHR
jgi:hypothetical protein